MLKKIGQVMFGIWIAGAFVSGIVNNYQFKKDCIEDEGFMKGWLFCSKESNYSFTLEMAKGMIWPIVLVSNVSLADSDTLTRDQLGDSRTFMAYVCWAGAIKLNNQEDSVALSTMIDYMRGQDESLNRSHFQYLGLASQEIADIESKGELSAVYNHSCRQPIENVKEAIQQGMLD